MMMIMMIIIMMMIMMIIMMMMIMMMMIMMMMIMMMMTVLLDGWIESSVLVVRGAPSLDPGILHPARCDGIVCFQQVETISG